MNSTDAPLIISSLIGGLLIGLSVTMMLLFFGRVTGISGIVGGLLQKLNRQNVTSKNESASWRLAFVAGLLGGGILISFFFPDTVAPQPERSTLVLVVAGLLVGFGTLMGSGCTSGHAVCGLSRLSPRSIISTLLFMVMGMLTVTFMRSGLQ